jgi:cardiolipin synthase
MNWSLLLQLGYIALLLFTVMRIIYDTDHVTKTLAYLLFAIFVPFLGIGFYFLLGINYRKRKLYSKKLVENDIIAQQLKKDVYQYSKQTFAESDASVRENKPLAVMLLKDSQSPLAGDNAVKLLINGEQKFPEVLNALKEAKHHIHIEYYIFHNDRIGMQILELLVQKAKEGVTVRLIFDDFGSHGMRKKTVKWLRENGVHAFPFYIVKFWILANRINYRNHRKIIVIDGNVAFTGGINVSDEYVNGPDSKNELYWRDTHARIEGPGVHYLQYLFLCDWNFCADYKLTGNADFFPRRHNIAMDEGKVVQIASSGPDSDSPTILFSILTAIHRAEKEILITTPYFIPGESLLSALLIAAKSGITVKLLVPGVSDSKFVDLAAASYFSDLMKSGVEIYQYQKGFIHAKTMVIDDSIAIVGSANMDVRSFDLNFEVNAIIYDEEINQQLREVFNDDLRDAKRIDAEEWDCRSKLRCLVEKSARLFSPLL